MTANETTQNVNGNAANNAANNTATNNATPSNKKNHILASPFHILIIPLIQL